MSEHIISTSAQESIRIAEKHLPNGTTAQQRALAMDVAEAISLCEQELAQEIQTRLRAMSGAPDER